MSILGRGRLLSLGALLGCLAIQVSAGAQSQPPALGFKLHRHEPTTAGSWFFSVEHPWYSSTRRFSGGLMFDYGHDLLVFGTYAPDGTFIPQTRVVEHALLGHLDLAASFLDRVLVTASLPVIFHEAGSSVSAPDGAMISPSGAGLGDLRLGVMVRVIGQPQRDAISLSAGLYAWLPLHFGDEDNHLGDSSGLHLLIPKLAVGGVSGPLRGPLALRWAINTGFVIRRNAVLSRGFLPAGQEVGVELQLSGALAIIDTRQRFSVGPEINLATSAGTAGAGRSFFLKHYTSVEILLGAQYLFFGHILAGVAVAAGPVHQPGTPDFRLLARVAYAPARRPVAGAPSSARTAPSRPVPFIFPLLPMTAPDAPPAPARGDRDGEGIQDRDDRVARCAALKAEGDVALQRGAAADAIRHFDELLGTCPDEFRLWALYGKARGYFKLPDIDLAQGACRQYLAEVPPGKKVKQRAWCAELVGTPAPPPRAQPRHPSPPR